MKANRVRALARIDDDPCVGLTGTLLAAAYEVDDRVNMRERLVPASTAFAVVCAVRELSTKHSGIPPMRALADRAKEILAVPGTAEALTAIACTQENGRAEQVALKYLAARSR